MHHNLLTSKNTRQTNFELLRIVAMCFVITHHFFVHSGLLDIENQAMLFRILIKLLDGGARGAVNIYVMISGYFLVKSRYSWKRLFFTYAEVLFYSLVLTWTFFFAQRLPGMPEVSLESCLFSFIPLVSTRYWFMTSYIALYLLSPFLNLLILRCSKEQHRFMIIVTLVLLCLVPTLFITITAPDLLQNNGYSFVWFIVLYLIASYFRLYGIPKIKTVYLVLGYLISSLAIPGIRFAEKFIGQRLIDHELGIFNWNPYNSLPVLIQALSVFILFSKINITNKTINKMILYLSSHSLGVYLIHDHKLMRSFLWLSLIKPSQYNNSFIIVAVLIVSVISIYISGTLIDTVRAILFKPLQRSKKLQAFFERLDGKTEKLLKAENKQ